LVGAGKTQERRCRLNNKQAEFWKGRCSDGKRKNRLREDKWALFMPLKQIPIILKHSPHA
jgi:hypothetical protein